ncbi:Na+/H+ antiporter NhaC [Alteromonas sp. KUL49]|uniref:Na+/H+ antiporter NhaC n=1 Tax=Alteromonas sp. KUL49 TaxID=2480798 RepID=UPI00102F0D95|nr:Na+/H+ antiporter NhaC [Alteromonas sp. KUL49]TAP40900.1 Na+/H+ antiporter NhaC [Alteromonas sp. KUL49]GEA11078.1 Na+/H+ antiporter NhaC [Alteromonas sp. KUL49]
MNKETKTPTLLDAFIPIVALVVMMGSAVILFEDNSSYGPNQIALLLAMGMAAIIGMKNGHSWKSIEKGIVKGISMSLGACLILLAVGSLIGTWMLAGTVPTLIYYGLELLNPSFFYAAACLICAVIAMSIGSSWTTAATVGVALMGVAGGMDMSATITAGAVVSGAYFGDKISPLSETTNLAPAVAGTDLFEHIRYMLWTTIPSFIIALILFAILGFSEEGGAKVERIQQMQALLNESFDLSIILLVPLVVLLTLAIKKMPAFPAVFIGALLGGIWAVLFQSDVILGMADQGDTHAIGTLKVVWTALFDGVSFSTPDENLNSLLSRGGMSSMLNTIWLIICAMSFGAVLENVGLLKRAVSAILLGAKSAGDMILRTILTCFGTNLVTADQYISIVMPGRMYKEEFTKRGLHQLNLSRSLEDGGTLTSPLIPWNTCGAYMHSVLLVNPFDYVFYAFFNVINPILAIIYGYLGVKILRITPPDLSEKA